MATVWQADPLWSQQNGIGVCTRIPSGAPAHLIVGSEPRANKASRCSSVRSPALPFPRTSVGRDGFSSDVGRCQEQGHLWQEFFLDWDNRRNKKSSGSPHFRRKGSSGVLWLNNMFKPAWVGQELVPLDMQMGHDSPPSNSSSPDNPEPGRPAESEMGSRCSSVRSPPLPHPRKYVPGDGISDDGRRQEQRQEHLWQQYFLDPTMWWDNRRDKKRSRSPDFRCKGSGEVLWLNNTFQPAWVDEQLVSLDSQMGQGASPSKFRSPDNPEPGRRAGCEMGSRRSSVRSPALPHPMGYGASPFEFSSQDKPNPERRAGSEMGVVTAVIVSTLCEQGKLSEAVGALESLAQSDSGVSQSLFYTVLKLCTGKKDLVLGRRVHELTIKLGYESNAYLGNHILRMYACAGRLKEAMDVFTRVGKPDVFMWFSIITAHAKHGKPKEAIQLYHEMRRSEVKADAHVFVAALQACAFAADLESGRNIHCDVVHSGIPTNLFVGSCLVDMYAKCGKMKDARQVFDSMATKDVVTWNALIAGYAQQGLAQEALVVYGQMEEVGLILADHVTFGCLLKTCASPGSPGALQKGREVHSHIVKRGLLDDVVVGTCLVVMYAKCGELEDAHKIFDSINTENVVT